MSKKDMETMIQKQLQINMEAMMTQMTSMFNDQTTKITNTMETQNTTIANINIKVTDINDKVNELNTRLTNVENTKSHQNNQGPSEMATDDGPNKRRMGMVRGEEGTWGVLPPTPTPPNPIISGN
eukprot:9282708-Heterocapsa_arctica.AAC.1